MSLAEKIQQRVQRLPASSQAEVLEFVERLLDNAGRREEKCWSELSLAFAMRGMEDEDIPPYTPDNLKVVFS